MRAGHQLGVLTGALLVTASALWMSDVFADGVPGTAALAYSGTLELPDGTPVTGSKDVRIELYNAVSGGQLQCMAMQTVALSAGRFQIVLPDTCTDATRKSPDLWVDVTVDGESLGRSKLAAVPYAIEASRAVAASSATGGLATQVVPKGAVMAFDLAACPAGWTALENARGRVVVGATPTLPLNTKLGADSLALSGGQLPSHSHLINDPGHTHIVGNVINYNVAPAFQPGGQGVGQGIIESSPSGTGISIQPSGNGEPFDNRQASLVLLYCKKD